MWGRKEETPGHDSVVRAPSPPLRGLMGEDRPLAHTALRHDEWISALFALSLLSTKTISKNNEDK